MMELPPLLPGLLSVLAGVAALVLVGLTGRPMRLRKT